MDEITSILDNSRSADEVINDLKEKTVAVPSWSKLINDYEPKLHTIVSDTVTRKDKIKSDGTVEKASRIYIGLEKLLTKRITEFMFSIPVRRVYHNIEDNEIK